MSKMTYCDPAGARYNGGMTTTQNDRPAPARPAGIVAVLHECTTNDTNGNPRRLFTGVNAHGHIVKVEDEGYAGRPEWVRELADAGVWDVHVRVAPGHYRDRLKLAARLAGASA